MANEPDPIAILSACRTPMGAFQGGLSKQSATALGAAAIAEAVRRTGIPAEDIDDVIMGCVLPAGLGQAPARQAAFGAGLPKSVPATTLNKMCGSGMKAAMLAADQIAGGDAGIVVAGGMESMTQRALSARPKARSGYRLGHGGVIDHMFLDGLEDAYDKGRLMGTFAEDCAKVPVHPRRAG